MTKMMKYSEAIRDGKSYPVTWHVNSIQLKEKGRSKGSLNVAVCGYSKKIAFLAPAKDVLKFMIIRDLYVHEPTKTCGDAEWCLCTSCPMNKVNLKKLGGYGIKNQKQLDRLLANVNKWQQDFSDIFTTGDIGVSHHYRKPRIIFTFGPPLK